MREYIKRERQTREKSVLRRSLQSSPHIKKLVKDKSNFQAMMKNTQKTRHDLKCQVIALETLVKIFNRFIINPDDQKNSQSDQEMFDKNPKDFIEQSIRENSKNYYENRDLNKGSKEHNEYISLLNQIIQDTLKTLPDQNISLKEAQHKVEEYQQKIDSLSKTLYEINDDYNNHHERISNTIKRTSSHFQISQKDLHHLLEKISHPDTSSAMDGVCSFGHSELVMLYLIKNKLDYPEEGELYQIEDGQKKQIFLYAAEAAIAAKERFDEIYAIYHQYLEQMIKPILHYLYPLTLRKIPSFWKQRAQKQIEALITHLDDIFKHMVQEEEREKPLNKKERWGDLINQFNSLKENKDQLFWNSTLNQSDISTLEKYYWNKENTCQFKHQFTPDSLKQDQKRITGNNALHRDMLQAICDSKISSLEDKMEKKNEQEIAEKLKAKNRQELTPIGIAMDVYCYYDEMIQPCLRTMERIDILLESIVYYLNEELKKYKHLSKNSLMLENKLNTVINGRKKIYDIIQTSSDTPEINHTTELLDVLNELVKNRAITQHRNTVSSLFGMKTTSVKLIENIINKVEQDGSKWFAQTRLAH